MWTVVLSKDRDRTIGVYPMLSWAAKSLVTLNMDNFKGKDTKDKKYRWLLEIAEDPSCRVQMLSKCYKTSRVRDKTTNEEWSSMDEFLQRNLRYFVEHMDETIGMEEYEKQLKRWNKKCDQSIEKAFLLQHLMGMFVGDDQPYDLQLLDKKRNPITKPIYLKTDDHISPTKLNLHRIGEPSTKDQEIADPVNAQKTYNIIRKKRRQYIEKPATDNEEEEEEEEEIAVGTREESTEEPRRSLRTIRHSKNTSLAEPATDNEEEEEEEEEEEIAVGTQEALTEEPRRSLRTIRHSFC